MCRFPIHMMDVTCQRFLLARQVLGELASCLKRPGGTWLAPDTAAAARSNSSRCFETSAALITA